MLLEEFIVKINFKTKNLEKALGGINQAEGALDKLATTAGRLGALLGGGLLAVGFKKMTSLAADAIEVANLIDVSFGNASDTFTKFAENLARQTNRSQFALKKAGGELQLTLMRFSESPEVAAERTMELLQRAVDVSSLYNMPVEEVMHRIASGLRGEPEAIKKISDISEQSLDQELAALGIGKTVRQLNALEKIELRYGKIMKDTEISVGDAVRTSRSLANALKGINAAVVDTVTLMGVHFQPQLSKVYNIVGDILDKVYDWTKANKDLVSAGLEVLVAVIAGTLIPLLTILAVKMTLVTWPVMVLAAAIAWLYIVIEDFVTFLQGGESTFQRFLMFFGVTGEQVDALRNALNRGIEKVKAFAVSIWEMMGGWQAFKGLLKAVGYVMMITLGSFITSLGLMLGNFYRMTSAVKVFYDVGKWVFEELSNLADWFNEKLDGAWGVVTDLADAVSDLFTGGEVNIGTREGINKSSLPGNKGIGNKTVKQNNRNTITINVDGGDPKQIEAAVRTGATKLNKDLLSQANKQLTDDYGLA